MENRCVFFHDSKIGLNGPLRFITPFLESLNTMVTVQQATAFDYLKKLQRNPAAMADPITPETLGAAACISK